MGSGNWKAGISENTVVTKEKTINITEDERVKVSFWAMGICFMFIPLFIIPTYECMMSEKLSIIYIIKQVFYKDDILVVSLSIMFNVMQEIMLAKSQGEQEKIFCMALALLCFCVLQMYTISAIHFYYTDTGNMGFLFKLNILFLCISIISCLFHYLKIGYKMKQVKLKRKRGNLN